MDSDGDNSSSEDDSDDEPVPSFAELVGRTPAAAGECTCDLDPCLCAAGGRAFKAKRDDQHVITPLSDGFKLDDATRLDAALSERLRPHQRECVPALALTRSERISNEVKRVSAIAVPPQV